MLDRAVLMAKPTIVVAATTVMLAIAALAIVVPSAAQVPPPPIASEPLTARAVFPNDIDLKVKVKEEGGETLVVNVEDPSRTVSVRFTVQPGAQFPWHSHAGPVFVNIVSGTLTYIDAETCAEQTYGTGEAFVDPGQGHVHSARNGGSAVTTFVATFFVAPASPDSLLIPADPADC